MGAGRHGGSPRRAGPRRTAGRLDVKSGSGVPSAWARTHAPMCVFSHAIVRPPGKHFADGLTSSGLPRPSYAEALDQHASYCAALQRCGLDVASLPASDEFPDAQFVEDVAVIAEGAAIITRPGAPSRRGEVELVRAALAERFPDVEEIAQPGTLDGGDVCEAGKHVYIGI